MKQEPNAPINISSIEASESLQSIKKDQDSFSQTILATLGGRFLMLWGLMAFCGYMGAHFFPLYEIWIWIAVAVIGYGGTAFFALSYGRQKIRVKNEASRQRIKKIYLVWISICGYGVLCMYILAPPTGFHSQAQIKIHTAMIPMLCWFLIGVVEEDKRSTWCSLVIMALVLSGFYFFPGDINMWLAFVVALPLFLIGLRPFLKWR